MSRNKPPAAPPAVAMAVAVASTGCSGLRLSLPRRGPRQQQQLALPRRNAEAAERLQLLKEQVDRLRLRLLEEEVERLSKLLLDDHQEKEMPVLRLKDGGYVREVRRAGRPWERLAVQVSRPVVHADAASASEVLDKMAAMGADHLCRYLVQSMPLKDIAGQNNPGEPVRRTTARLSSGDDDGLVLKAMGKLESLVLEGLKIQITEPATAAAAAVGRRPERDEAVGNDGKGCRVLVVLMQARDPTERYAAVGDPMIGLIEASLDPERKDATARLLVQGLHIAGIRFMDRNPSDGRRMMWSAFLRQCKESHDGDGGGGGDGCRCTCVRNPNRVLQR